MIFSGCSAPPGGGGGNDNSAPTVDPVFAADYRTTYRLVRDCRNSSAHPATMRVYVNEVGADAYEAEANPLPEGTIVVKEEFGGTDCDDDGQILSWVAMLKREPGYDADDGDWQWQRVLSPNRGVFTNDKSSCISCHRAPDCLVRDLMCTEP